MRPGDGGTHHNNMRKHIAMHTFARTLLFSRSSARRFSKANSSPAVVSRSAGGWGVISGSISAGMRVRIGLAVISVGLL
jgi:hypothetical protein